MNSSNVFSEKASARSQNDSNESDRAVSETFLPDGWCWAQLADLAASEGNSITDGPFGSNLKTEHYTAAGPRVIRLQNIGDGKFVDASAHISEVRFEQLRKHEVKAGDLLIAALGEILPRSCIAPSYLGPAIVKADCIRLRPNPEMSSKYLNMALISDQVRQQANSIVHGVGRPRMNLGEIKSLLIPLAPFAEQERIVERIEELLSQIDAGADSLRDLQKKLKRYRAAVLKAACEGTLVPTEAELARAEGRDYEPASELLARVLAERRARWEADQLAKMRAKGTEPKDDRWKAKYEDPAASAAGVLPDLPEGWAWASVQQVGRVQLGRQRAPQHHDGPNMRPYLRVANVFDDRIDLSDVKTMNFEPHEFESYRLSDGDILLNEGQSLELVGRAALYRNQLPDACFQNTLVRFRAHDGLSPRFALAVFRHYFFSGRFQKIARWTTSIAHLGADRFASLEFPLPPLAEQERIVAEVERRLSVIDQMEAALRDNLKRADRLRQAVLRDAFAGKLVPQDPNDEPASVLLERIRAERAAAEAAGKTVRTRTARTATTTNGAEVPKKSRGRSAGTKTVPDDSAPLSLFSDENTPGAATGSVQTAVEFPDTAGVAA